MEFLLSVGNHSSKRAKQMFGVLEKKNSEEGLMIMEQKV